MKRTLKVLVWGVLLAALLDLSTTFILLRLTGLNTELNPVVRGFNGVWIMFVIKAFVVGYAYYLAKTYYLPKTKDIMRHIAICFMAMLILAQGLAGLSNGYKLSQLNFGIPVMQGTGEIIKTENNTYEYYEEKGGEKTLELVPPDATTATKIYVIIIGIFLLYPMIFSIITYWLKRRVDNEENPTN